MAEGHLGKMSGSAPMHSHTSEEHIGRVAADILFGGEFIDLLDRIYSDQENISEFESNPKRFLTNHGIDIPDEIEVLIHTPGEPGRLPRVDLHWREKVDTYDSTIRTARHKMRELAQAAADILHSPEMKRLRQTAMISA
jgi:hypothetical protein